MTLEQLRSVFPQELTSQLSFNRENTYQRTVESVTWIPPDELPFVFHTAHSELNEVDPIYCQSYDYLLNGETIPVSYFFARPHVNRVKKHSELWFPHKQEGYEQSGLSYTYLTITKEKGAWIRIGSSMLDQYLLAGRNNGLIFRVNMAEGRPDGSKQGWNEYISLIPVPVIESYKFDTTSPVGIGGGGLETHVTRDISDPKFTGFQPIYDYLDSLKAGPHKTEIIDIANELMTINHPDQLLHGVFRKLVKENAISTQIVVKPKQRLFICNFHPKIAPTNM